MPCGKESSPRIAIGRKLLTEEPSCEAEDGIGNPGCDRHTRRVVKEGPEQVLPDVAHCRCRQPPCAHEALKIAFQERDAGALNRPVPIATRKSVPPSASTPRLLAIPTSRSESLN